MTMMQDVLQGAAIGVGVTHKPQNLSVIKKPGCAAAILQRQPLPAFQRWIDGLDPERLPYGRLILKPQSVHHAVSKLCDAAQLPDGPHRQFLVNDIEALSVLFCDLMAAPFVRLRLDRVTSNACRRFHIDAITARLVCTYRGTGTQYGISTRGADPERVFTVPTGNPVLLRGTLWPAEPHAGLMHRSPQIEGSGETWLVLVLDPIFDLEGEA